VISRDNRDTTTEQVRWLIDRILTLLARMAAAGNSDKASEFRQELEKCKRTIVSPVQGDSIDFAVRRCLAICQDFFQSTENYRLNNEQTYSEIIDLLRNAIRALSAGSNLEDSVITSTTRFRAMVEMNDLAEVKRLILSEVAQLEHTVQEHRAKREKTINELSERSRSLEERLSRTRARLNQTLAESATDSLTRVANRHHFDGQLEAWIAPGAAEQPFALAMFDIDDFKKINDTHGHQMGDRVLQGVAQTMRQLIRDNDVLARYGGEEFVLMLRNLTGEKAFTRCQDIVRSVAGKVFELEAGGRLMRVRATVSCGLTDYSAKDSNVEVVRRADTALYQAKRHGKNRVEVQDKHRRSGAA